MVGPVVYALNKFDILFYVLFADDILLYVLFADDTNVFSNGKDINIIMNTMQLELSKLYN